AAKAAGEPSWSNATWLVRLDEQGHPGPLLRAKDVGLGDADRFVVRNQGRLIPVDPNGKGVPVKGDLLVEGEEKGIRYKSSFQLLKEQAFARSLTAWADTCGLKARDIADTAREFTAHGKKVAAEMYRGPVQHTNGYYNGQAIIALNVLVGNSGHKGGLTSGGGHWHEFGSKKGQPFNVKKGLHPGALKAFGLMLTKEKAKYEESTLFAGYPAKRPWYPFTNNVYQEIIPAAAAGYPYPIQALFLHMGTPAFAAPAGHLALDYLGDPKKLPLFFACDVVIGETSMYADYLFPDLSIWERWATPHTTPDVNTKSSKVRQPIVAPLTEKVQVYGEEIPISLEAVMLAIAEKLGLPGHGKDGFGPGQDFLRPDDFYLRAVANIAAGDKPGDAVPEASEEELKIFQQARRHLPPSVFDPKRWEALLGGSLWRRVVYVLNRGGRYEDFAKTYKGNYLAHAFHGQFNLYVEDVARAKNAMTGRNFSGLPIFEPPREASGQVVKDAEYPFHLITFKEVFGGQSRTVGNYWVTSALPENFVIMSALDAARLGFKRGDIVKLASVTNQEGVWDLQNGRKIPVAGKVLPIQGLRPGVVAVSWHYGHWAYGAGDAEIDGKLIKGDPRRATGLCPNAVMRADRGLKNVCLTDPIGGSASFYDTRVKLAKV
ncbi:MAG: molybdopterin oxidoreductase, partial [Candidatus Binatia bacterium]